MMTIQMLLLQLETGNISSRFTFNFKCVDTCEALESSLEVFVGLAVCFGCSVLTWSLQRSGLALIMQTKHFVFPIICCSGHFSSPPQVTGTVWQQKQRITMKHLIKSFICSCSSGAVHRKRVCSCVGLGLQFVFMVLSGMLCDCFIMVMNHSGELFYLFKSEIPHKLGCDAGLRLKKTRENICFNTRILDRRKSWVCFFCVTFVTLHLHPKISTTN